jgi:hypothetical protein
MDGPLGFAEHLKPSQRTCPTQLGVPRIEVAPFVDELNARIPGFWLAAVLDAELKNSTFTQAGLPLHFKIDEWF